MKRRAGGIVFALAVGLAIAILSYRWLTDPQPRAERLLEERVVQSSRYRLQEVVAAGELEIVDPLAPDRKVGKVYIYPHGGGWEVSGYYRRGESDLWHPYLMRLDAGLSLMSLKVSDRDPALIERAAEDASLEVLP